MSTRAQRPRTETSTLQAHGCSDRTWLPHESYPSTRPSPAASSYRPCDWKAEHLTIDLLPPGSACVTAPAAVTHAAVRENAALALSLSPRRDRHSPCRHHDAFGPRPDYPSRLRLSRVPCQTPLAYAQRIIAAPTGATPMHRRGHRQALSFHIHQKENHPPSNLACCLEGAIGTAHRLALARTLEVQLKWLPTSMSSLRSLVLVTPRLATANRVDLNTYRDLERSSTTRQVAPPCRR
jgi:hypothetical protein